MLRNLKFPALILGALMAILGPAAYAADRGGHGGGGGHAQSFSRGSVGHSNVGHSNGFAGRSYNNERREFRGGDRDHYRGGYYGGYGYYGPSYGFYYGSPYGYGYPYSGCGYYDQWGNWIANPYCYGY